jgi:hypothetical protein
MKHKPSTMIKSCFLILTLLSVSFTTQARDSLAALRNDLNAAVTTLQAQITALQTQVDSLTPDGFAIGETGPAGGIVFFITDAGAHGLEAAPEDQGAAQWGCNGTSIPGANGTAIGTGAQNTAAILAGCNEAGIAAQLAADYTWPNGQTDGYLPSKDELNVLFQRRAVVGDFAADNHWSSSELSLQVASLQLFSNGGQGLATKSLRFRVRAVRAF